MEHKSNLLARLVQACTDPDQAQGVKKTSPIVQTNYNEEGAARICTDFDSGVPPNEANQSRGVHTRDEKGRVLDKRNVIVPEALEESIQAEEYGPKTAAMPDTTVFPSEKMEELLDVGSLPDSLKRKPGRC
jgi:hypothetical protein